MLVGVEVQISNYVLVADVRLYFIVIYPIIDR
jgi:hypothetical protein